MYQSLGISLGNWVEALQCLKEEAIALLGGEDAAEVIPYFDHIIQALASPGPPYCVNNGFSPIHHSVCIFQKERLIEKVNQRWLESRENQELEVTIQKVEVDEMESYVGKKLFNYCMA